MTSPRRLGFVLLFILLGTTAEAQNLLTNGGFDRDLGSWSSAHLTNPAQQLTWASGSARMSLGPPYNNPYGVIFQIVPVSAGKRYTARVRAFANGGPGNSRPAVTQLATHYLTGPGYEFFLDHGPNVYGATANAWETLSVEPVTPPGTTHISVALWVYHTGTTGDEVIGTFDDAELTGPCVTAAQAPGAVPSGVAYNVIWESTGSASYEIHEATRADFSDAISATVTGTTKQYTHTVTSPTTYFYRVRPLSCGSGSAQFGAVAQTVVLSQQSPSLREFDVVVPLGSTARVTQQVRFEKQPPGASFTASSDQPFLTVTPQSGTVDSSGIVTLSVTGDPRDLQVGANTGTVLLTVTTPSAGLSTHGTTTVSSAFSVSLVTPVSSTPRGQPTDDAVIIPAVAHLEGSGARFQSDIRLTNGNATEKTYLLSFTSSYAGDKATERQTSITVQPEQTVALNDVLRDFFGFAQPSDSAGGSLEVRSTSGPMGSTFVTSRTYATTSLGTYGQFIPAVRLAKFIGLGTGALTLTQVSQNNAFRSNIGIVEGLGGSATGRLRVFNKSGQNVKEAPFSLRPFEFLQFGQFLANQGVPMDDARIEIVVDSGSGKVTGYASVLDNTTQDPLLSSPVKTSDLSANRYVLPGMADLESPATNFHSDVRIFNPSASAVPITLTYYPQGNPGAATARSATLAPAEILAYDNVLPTLFGLRGTGGSIVVTTADNRALVVSGRTYSNAPGGGTFGQFIPAVTPAEGIAVGDPPLQLLQLEQSPNFRSNVGLNELTGNQAAVEVTVAFADSKATAVTSLTLQGNEFRQLGSLIASLAPGRNAYNARVFVRVTAGTGRVAAYASVIDNLSLDPTYVPAQR